MTHTKDEVLISLITELVGIVALYDMEKARRLGKRVHLALAAPPVQELQRYSPNGEGGMEVDSLGAYVKHQDVSNPPAQPAPANLWLYWKVNNKSVITGPFKTHSKDEAYGLDCIDQTPLTVPAAQRTWVGLTDEDKLTVRRMPWETLGDLMDNTEAKLRSKNT